MEFEVYVPAQYACTRTETRTATYYAAYTRFVLSSEMIDWLMENGITAYRISSYGVFGNIVLVPKIWFENEDDALLFKLTFL